jgi:hypothetical protein
MRERLRRSIDALKRIPRDEWKNKLDTDHEGAVFGLTENARYLDSYLMLHKIIRDTLVPTTLIEEEDLPIPIDETLKEDIIILCILKEYLSKLNREVIYPYLRGFLEEQGAWEELINIGQNHKLMIAVLLMDTLNLESLHLILLVSRYERFSYQEYQLLMNLDGIQDPEVQAQLRQIERNGIENLHITEEMVNIKLANFETINRTRLSSVCLNVLNYNGETIIFILREAHRGGFKTLQEYIVGWNAELIILRFGQGCKTLKARAVDSVKEEVYTSIASSIAKNLDVTLPLNYVKTSQLNSVETVTTLMQSLLTNNIPGIDLHEIELSSTPFPGRPSITIQKKSEEIPLTTSLENDALGYSLISMVNLSFVSKIKIKYTTGPRSKHIYILKIIPSNERFFILFSTQGGGGTSKRLRLTQLIRENSGARIIEAKEN